MKAAKVVLSGVVAAALLSTVSCTVGGGTLKYRQALPPVLQQEVPLIPQVLTPAAAKPRLKAEPQYEGTPVYFLIDLGQKGSPPHVAAYDPKGGGGKGCVYFDLDQDSDLAEEEPILPQPGGDYNFGPIAVKLKRDGSVGLYHCWMRRSPGLAMTGTVSRDEASASISVAAGFTPQSWRLLPGGMNVGEITFSGKTYQAATADAWTNGRFNDICWSRLGQGDILLVDWNGDGKFGGNADEYVLVGDRYWRNGEWYRLHISTDGTKVSFSPRDFELAPLLTGHEKFWMQVTSQSNTGSVLIDGTGGRVDLPLDQYRLHLCWMERQDAQGNTWRADALYNGPYPLFQVNVGENRYPFGPPFTVSVKPSPEGPYHPGQRIDFAMALTGTEGKLYRLVRNGQQMPGPEMVFRDSSGKEVGSVQFAYPSQDPARGSWMVPTNVGGKVTATISVDAGPFAWKAEDLVLEVK